VAEQRRALPLGGAVSKPYRFEGENGAAAFPICLATSRLLRSTVICMGQSASSLARCARLCFLPGTAKRPMWSSASRWWWLRRSPIERLAAFKKARGWRHLKLYSDPSGDYTRDYVSADDADVPAFNVFTRRDGTIRHFWSGEMGFGTADPGQDPRGAPDLMPLWTILDSTPEGRGTDWYPKLNYPK